MRDDDPSPSPDGSTTGRFWALDWERLEVVAVVACDELPDEGWWVPRLGKRLPHELLYPPTDEGEMAAQSVMAKHCAELMQRALRMAGTAGLRHMALAFKLGKPVKSEA